MLDQSFHIPVLVHECLSFFEQCPPKTFCDVTLGSGGHAEAFLKTFPSIELYDGSDRDLYALQLATERLKSFHSRVQINHRSFMDLLDDPREGIYDGMIADLGVSSMQLNNLDRGFSFQGEDHPLDMRMDRSKGETASDVLQSLSEEELGSLFRTYGEEPLWRQVASAVVRFRKKQPILTVKDLKLALASVFPPYRLRRKIHPLTLVFQALRVYVNKEDEQLRAFLDSAIRLLAPKGRLLVISFCSTEDRPVKWFFKQAKEEGVGHILTKKVITPAYDEVRKNPRSRSAKLRCFEKQ